MNAVGFAWRSLVRQPARASLGVLGVAAVGALLFDMLLLSHGLVLSMRDLLDSAGFDLRVTASDALPGQGPTLDNAIEATNAIEALPTVRNAIALRFVEAQVATTEVTRVPAAFQGVAGNGAHPWTMVRGRDVKGEHELVINQSLAQSLEIDSGARVQVRASCSEDRRDAPPPLLFTVAGIAAFPFDSPTGGTIATTMAAMDEACGAIDAGRADVILVASQQDAGGAAAAIAIAQAVPALKVLTNEDAVGRFERGGFTYFRQISTVLITVTLSFSVLLITVLLTVSVNQRLGEIAALRALGFSRWRVVADVLCESALIVGTGAVLSLPLGGLLALGLDSILKSMPGMPADVHFFVFQPSAIGVHAALMVLTALTAAIYPMQAVARLPIAATLRNEVVG